MQKLTYEQIDLAPTASVHVGVYPAGHQCPGVGWHIHPEYEVVFIKNGRGVLNIGTKQVVYEDGVLLFLGPNIPHTDFGNSDFPNQLEVVVQFDETFVTQRLAAFPEFKRLTKLIDQSRYGLICSRSAHETVADSFEAIPKLGRLSQLLLFLESLQIMALDEGAYTLFDSPADLPSPQNAADLERLDQIFRIVNAQYDDLLTSTSMAKAIGMTTNSFCRFFKAQTNQTFTVFLNNFRLERAKDLLKRKPVSIQEVMYACGFRDAPYFSRKFRDYTGVSPREFQDIG